MKSACIPAEALERIAALPEGHVTRAHLERCPRCQAMLRLLREFRTSQQPADADPAAVESRLEAIVDGLLAEPAGHEGGARVLPMTPPTRRRWLALRSPARMLAAALVVLAIGAPMFAVLRQPQRPARGNSAAPAPGRREPASIPEGQRLSWPKVEGAEEYRVLVFDEAKSEIACVGPVRETTLVLGLGALPATVVPGERLGWRVEALAHGDVLQRSPMRTTVAR